MAKKKHSYGILLHRINAKSGKIQVFLGKANGPRYWNRTSKKVWGLPKGRPDIMENQLQTALREFAEEVGMPAPNIDYQKMMDFDTPHNKIITVFIGDATGIKGIKYKGSNILETEYPVGTDEIISYAEVSDAKWVGLEKARKIMMYGQQGILEAFAKTIV